MEIGAPFSGVVTMNVGLTKNQQLLDEKVKPVLNVEHLLLEEQFIGTKVSIHLKIRQDLN